MKTELRNLSDQQLQTIQDLINEEIESRKSEGKNSVLSSGTETLKYKITCESIQKVKTKINI